MLGSKHRVSLLVFPLDRESSRVPSDVEAEVATSSCYYVLIVNPYHVWRHGARMVFCRNAAQIYLGILGLRFE